MATEAPRELWVEYEVIRQDKALGQAFGFRLDDGFCAGTRIGVEFPGSEGAAGERLGATADVIARHSMGESATLKQRD